LTDKLVKFWRNQARQQKSIVFLLAWLVSLLLWFLTAINAPYSHTFSLRVVARPMLEDIELSGDSVRTLEIELYGRGLELIQQYQRLKKFELSAYPGQFDDSSLVNVQNMHPVFAAQVLPKLQLIRFHPDTFHFRYRKLYGRNIAIKPNLKLHFSPGYGQTAPLKFLPDSIRIFSYRPLRNPPNELHLEAAHHENLKATLRFANNLLPPSDTLLFVRKNQVLVEVPVHRITEGKLTLPIQLVPEIPGIRLVPATIEVSFEAALHHFKNIGASDFKVNCYWENRTASGHLAVIVSCSQPEVLRFKVFPKQIDYILP